MRLVFAWTESVVRETDSRQKSQILSNFITMTGIHTYTLPKRARKPNRAENGFIAETESRRREDNGAIADSGLA